MELLEQITQNPIFGLSGWILGFISLCYAFISKTRKQLSFRFDTDVLVNNKLSNVEGLNISFNDKPVEQLSVTKFVIQNTGNTRIEEESDIYENYGLTIIPKNTSCKIYGAKTISESNETIKCYPDNKDGVVYVHFDAFEKTDKVIINIYHTGNSEMEFDLKGKIKNSGKISRNFDNVIEGILGLRSKGIKYISIFAGIMLLISNLTSGRVHNLSMFLLLCIAAIIVSVVSYALIIFMGLVVWTLSSFKNSLLRFLKEPSRH